MRPQFYSQAYPLPRAAGGVDVYAVGALHEVYQQCFSKLRAKKKKYADLVSNFAPRVLYIHQLLDLHRVTTFRIHSSYYKITRVTWTNFYKTVSLAARIGRVLQEGICME